MALHYVDPEAVEAGGAMRWGDWADKPSEWRGATQPFTTIDLACGSDYSGSGLIERSNYEVILADPELRPHVVEISGGHGTFGVGYLGTPDDPPEELRDTLAALDGYPLLSDDDHSEREMQAEGMAWDDYGARDFANDLEKAIYQDTGWDHEQYLEALAPGDLRELWIDGCDQLNINGGAGYVVEQGGSVHFYIGEWIESARRAGWLAHLSCEWSGAIVPGADKEADLAITDGLCLAGNVFTDEESSNAD